MWINFCYEGSTKHLNRKKRKQLEGELKECLSLKYFNYFEITSIDIYLTGSYHFDYNFVHEDIEHVLDKYSIDWKGDVEFPD